ncbi:hypothetical protein ACFLZA_00510 [Candidatus Neomarinimicrobiota bacterium]
MKLILLILLLLSFTCAQYLSNNIWDTDKSDDDKKTINSGYYGDRGNHNDNILDKFDNNCDNDGIFNRFDNDDGWNKD